MKKITFAAKPRGTSDRHSRDEWVNDRQAAEPTKRLTIDIPMNLHKRIKSQCALRDVPMADEIRELLEKHFPEKHQETTGIDAPSPN